MNDVEMIRQGYADFAAGDLDAVRELLAPDCVWHVPGRSSMSGDYRGPDAVIGYFLDLFERSAGTVKAELKECGELAPGLVSCLVHLSADMPHGRVDQDFVQIFRREDGKTKEVWGYPEDQYAMDETDSRTPAGIVRRGYEAFGAGDMDTLREIMAPDVTWTEPGRSALSGTYRGIDATLGLFGTLFERSGGTMEVELIGCAEIAPGIVAALSHDTATMPAGELDSTTVHVFRIQDGRAVEVTSYPADVYAFDAAVGGAITLPDARSAEQAAPVTT